MNITETALDGVVIIEPSRFVDQRGWFSVVYSDNEFSENVLPVQFVQDNESFSHYGVVRGLHYQLPPFAQGKLVRVTEGTVLDVAVDIRRGSPTFGKHIAVELSAENNRQLFIPRGFAHGFAVLCTTAKVQYKCDNHYAPQCERGIIWNDPELAIDWGIAREVAVVSGKDAASPVFARAELFEYDDKPY